MGLMVHKGVMGPHTERLFLWVYDTREEKMKN